MKYSYNWIQKHIQEELPEIESLKETIIFHAFEVESVEERITQDGGLDYILDIKVLPDRAHDAFSHGGMAREIAGLLGLTLKKEEFPNIVQKDLSIKIDIKTDLCKRYIAIELDNIKVDSSPSWLVEKLESVGTKSINNIVDVANYVMFDIGQPIHIFDKDKIDGGIVVDFAHEGEKITTLTNEERVLTQNDLVISDYVGPLAIAGVKGGKNAEVTQNTKNIIVEVANFDSVSIRKTSRSLNLITDASKRFENEISVNLADRGAKMMLGLLKEISKGECSGLYSYGEKAEPRIVEFCLSDITRLLGESITDQNIIDVFEKYGYKYTIDNQKYLVEIPIERLDLVGPHDIAEEIGRVVGYDKISEKTFVFTGPVRHSEIYTKIRSVKAWLVGEGYREVLTYTFRKKGEIYVARGTKDKSALRANLSDGLKESFDLNKSNMPLLGMKSDLKVFEIGTVFSPEEVLNVATINNGIIKEITLDQFIEENKIGVIDIEISKTNTKFKPWSVYPYITRDIAVWVSNQDSRSELELIISNFAKEYCVREEVLFDQFTKENKTSLAWRLVFQSFERTLTEVEIERWMDILVKKIKEIAGLEIR